MKSTISQYSDNLRSMPKKVKITDRFNKERIFSAGIKLAVEMILSQVNLHKKLICIGNGGSAAICSHLVSDFCKNAGVVAMDFNDPALITSISNDSGYGSAFEKLISVYAEKGDVLIAISSSGQSENILKATAKAKEIGCRIITFSGFGKGNRLRKTGDLNFYIPVNRYGIIEVVHLAINHLILDIIAEQRKAMING